MSAKGCRALTNEEVEDMLIAMGDEKRHKFPYRDTAILMLQIGIGFRVAGLLSLKVDDVYNVETKRVRRQVTLQKKNNKGKHSSHTVPIPDNCVPYLERYFKKWRWYFSEDIKPDHPLFPSCHKSGYELVPMGSRRVRDMYLNAKRDLDLDGKISTHSARKTLAQRMMDATGGDIVAVKEVLGHKTLEAAMRYVTKDLGKVHGIMRGLSHKDGDEEGEKKEK